MLQRGTEKLTKETDKANKELQQTEPQIRCLQTKVSLQPQGLLQHT